MLALSIQNVITNMCFRCMMQPIEAATLMMYLHLDGESLQHLQWGGLY